MKRALEVIQMVVTDSGTGSSGMPASDVVLGGKEQQPRDVNLNSHHSPPLSTVNAADSGISLSQLQTTASRAIKDFEVHNLLFGSHAFQVSALFFFLFIKPKHLPLL